jgi:hypothetical protein
MTFDKNNTRSIAFFTFDQKALQTFGDDGWGAVVSADPCVGLPDCRLCTNPTNCCDHCVARLCTNLRLQHQLQLDNHRGQEHHAHRRYQNRARHKAHRYLASWLARSPGCNWKTPKFAMLVSLTSRNNLAKTICTVKLKTYKKIGLRSGGTGQVLWLECNRLNCICQVVWYLSDSQPWHNWDFYS